MLVKSSFSVLIYNNVVLCIHTIFHHSLLKYVIILKIFKHMLIYFNRTVSTLSWWVALYYSNRVANYCNKVLFQELLDCFGNDLENNFENNAWNFEHNTEQLQEILNWIMQRIMSKITSALVHTIIYRLIATATITFRKQKGAATKQGQLLYEGDHLTLVEYPSSSVFMVPSYVSNITGNLQCISNSYNLLANTDSFTYTFITTVEMKLEVLEINL